MKKNLTELVFILDRSGSMAGLEADTIGGFNAMIEKQRGEPGEAVISTVLFNNETEVIHDRVPLNRVPALTEKEYYVRGCTALLDAVGGAIHHIGNVHKYAREEDRPEKTLFVITTDGMENASRRYTYDKVKAMIERQRETYGWEFLFECSIQSNSNGYRIEGTKTTKQMRLFGFEPHQTELSKYVPGTLIDISEVYEQKVAAMQCFKAQKHLINYYTERAHLRGNHLRRISGNNTYQYGESFSNFFPVAGDELV